MTLMTPAIMADAVNEGLLETVGLSNEVRETNHSGAL